MIALRERFEKRSPDPRFQVGQIVRHRRYGYRGVVVSLDECCRADEGWYFSNKTQPDREQPWYHILVDESDQTTYAAEENLENDPNKNCVVHPWVILFFDRFENGRYQRNSEPWPPGPE